MRRCLVVGGSVFEKAGGRRAGSESTLCAAADVEGLGVCELDIDVVLVDTGELAVEFVGVAQLLDVKLGVEALHDAAAGMVMVIVVATFAGGGAFVVGVEVVEEAEERVEGGGVVGDEGFWEERHLAYWGVEESSLSLIEWKSFE